MQGNVRQEDRVLVLTVDRLNDFGLVRPDPNRVSLQCQKVGERRAPTAGPEHSDQGHGRGALAVRRPKRFSVPLSSRSMFRRCSTITPTAINTSIQSSSGMSGGSSRYTATGSTAAAAMLASDTYPVSMTTTPQTAAATPSASGVSASITPAAVATPFPPLKPTNTENTCPIIAATPQARANSSEADTRGAKTRTGIAHFAI